MPRRAAPHTSRSRMLLTLASLLSLLAILACGISLHGGMGAPPLPVTHLPASKLRLAIQITGQYGDKPNVYGSIGFLDGTKLTPVTIPANASLTCNGSDITPSPHGEIYFSCPRQPPGGSYRFTFTDEHGAATTVVVPVPTGTLAILSPQAGSTVPIPTNGKLAIRYSIPIPPPHDSVAIDSISVWCRVSTAEPCGAVGASLQPYGTPTPAGPVPPTSTPYRGLPTPTANGLLAPTPTENRGAATPTPGGFATPKPGDTPTPTPYVVTGNPATATVTQRGGLGTIVLAGDYSAFQPGKAGGITMYMEVHVTPDRGAFMTASTVFTESVSTSITWTR